MSKLSQAVKNGKTKWSGLSGKKKLMVAAGVVVLLLVVSRVPGMLAEKEPPAPEFFFEEVARRTISSTLEGTGTVQPVNSYTVKALVTGDVLSAPFEEGDIIEAGKLLFQIDPDRAKNSYTQSQLSLQTAQEEAGKLNVTAPADGQIVKIHYEQGESINAGSLLIELQDRQNMLLKVPFLTTEASQLQPGQTAEVIMQSTGERFSGTITEISSVQQVGAGGTLTHEVSILVQNPGGLTEGVFATAEAGGFVCAGSGTFEYRHSENVMAEVNGDLAELYVKEGDIVSKGQSLLRISSTQVETNLRNAQLSLDNAQAQLDEYTITSPIAGTVIEKKFEQGDTIDSNNSASEMAVIYDMSQLEFTMNIDELDIGKLQVGQKVQITCDALEGEQFEGYVSKISINGKSNNGVTTYPVTVKLDDYGNLLPGMNINATVMLQQAENVLTVPAGAVQRGNLVLVQGTESTVEPPAGQTTPEGYVWREVEIGANDDSYIEIISGLEEGDMIAVPANAMDSGGFGGPGGPGGPGGEVVVTAG